MTTHSTPAQPTTHSRRTTTKSTTTSTHTPHPHTPAGQHNKHDGRRQLRVGWTHTGAGGLNGISIRWNELKYTHAIYHRVGPTWVGPTRYGGLNGISIPQYTIGWVPHGHVIFFWRAPGLWLAMASSRIILSTISLRANEVEFPSTYYSWNFVFANNASLII